ncbi:MAG: hypothetical protein WA993_06605 [Candidatus Binatus sp.]|jgi:hypothetical protein
MQEIRSFDIWQTSKVCGVWKGTAAWIVGVFLALRAIGHGHPLIAIFFIILFPVVVGALGYVVVALLCWLYNQVAERFGGIAFELAPRSEP